MSKAAAGLSAVLLAALTTVAMAAGNNVARSAKPTPAEAVDGHCTAWNTTDRAERDRLLERVFAVDGVYSDPDPTYAAGRTALSNEIGKFQRENQGVRFRCSAPQTHHGARRVSWLMLGPDGKVRVEGMDFYELAKSGQIRRVTGFFGPAPPIAP